MARDTQQPEERSVDLGRGESVGRYLVIGLVGKGGMGEVYAAYDPELDRKIALKLLRPHRTAGVDPSEGRARLLREAQSIARLSDPNVVVVFDVGMFGDRVFLAMEFVDGDTLGYWVNAQPRTWREVIVPYIAAGRGLACAHRSGVVHRDFKPDNVMIGRDGKVRVMDFGLARSIDPGGDQSAGDELRRTTSPRAEGLVVETTLRRSPAGSAVTPGGRVARQPLAQGERTAEDDLATRNLSRPTAGRDIVPGVGAAPLNTALTASGDMMGTPAYMAPEQFRGQKIDARADQFSFCVALYEGLYGERPFGGKTIHELTASVLAGRVKEAPANIRVPGWLRRVLLRGLRVDPAARYPSLDVLLELLGRDPARTRRRWVVAASAGMLIMGLAGGLVRVQQQQRMRCLGAAAKLDGIWELPGGRRPSARKEAIRRAFMATGKPYAADSFTVVVNALDRYVVGWTDMHRESCEATNMRGDQSAEVLDLRTSCLQERFSEVRALTNVFKDANGDVVTNAIQAVQAIRPIEQCADIAALRAVVRPPDDPAARREVADVRTALADVKALTTAGRYKQAQRDIAGVTARARRTKYAPVIAEVLLQLGEQQLNAGDGKAAEKFHEEAVLLAEGARHDQVVLEAEAHLVYGLGYYQDRYQEAERWARLGRAVLTRLGPGHDVVAGWLSNNLALVYQKEGRFPEALATHLEALELKERALGGRHFDVGISQGNVALALFDLGRIAEANERNDLALKITAQSVSREHPQYALLEMNGAEYANALGQYAKARVMAEHALGIQEREFGSASPMLGYTLTIIGLGYVEGGEPELAVPYLERALRIRQSNDLGGDLCETRFVLARALWDSGQDRGRALALAELARADYHQSPRHKAKSAGVDLWIEARRAGARATSISMR